MNWQLRVEPRLKCVSCHMDSVYEEEPSSYPDQTIRGIRYLMPPHLLML